MGGRAGLQESSSATRGCTVQVIEYGVDPRVSSSLTYEVCAGEAYTEHASEGRRARWRAKTLADTGLGPDWAGYSGDSEAGILSGISRKCRMRSGFY